MADDHGLEVFSKQFGEVLAELGESGAKLPFYVVALAVNGTMYFVRIDSYGNAEPLAEYTQKPGFQLPINIMVVDGNGDAWRVLMSPDKRYRIIH
jgi:hypothetical protein